MRQKRLVFLLLLVWMMVGMLAQVAAQQKGLVIVNKSVPVDSLSQSELQKIFTGKIQNWENNLKVKPVLLDPKSDLGKRFFDNLLEMSAREYNRIWLKTIFSGSSPRPLEMSTPEQVMEYVAQKDGGIGIIPAELAESELLENCKVLKIPADMMF